MIEKNESYFSTVQRYAGRFITDDSEDSNNILFRKLLSKKTSNKSKQIHGIFLLSWLYMQQKDYSKALVQEKALVQKKS